MIEQLIKKDCNTGEYSNMNPITVFKAVIDPDTNKTLSDVTEDINHIYLPYKKNVAWTRVQVPIKLRKKGLWITYVNPESRVITEYFKGDNFDNNSWSADADWVPYLSDEAVKSYMDEILSWYKA